MTALEKYEEMIRTPQLRNGALRLTVCKMKEYVEIKASFGGVDFGQDPTANGWSVSEIYLTPEEVDNLIERLQIAKNAVLEQ